MRLALVVLALACASCAGQGPVPVSPTCGRDAGAPPLTGDAGLLTCRVGEINDDCQAAESTLCRLQCVHPDDGTPIWRSPIKRFWFADVCRQAQADKRNWRPDCIARIKACSQFDEAYFTPEGRPCPF